MTEGCDQIIWIVRYRQCIRLHRSEGQACTGKEVARRIASRDDRALGHPVAWVENRSMPVGLFPVPHDHCTKCSFVSASSCVLRLISWGVSEAEPPAARQNLPI